MHYLGPVDVSFFVWFGIFTVFTDFFFLTIITAGLICIWSNYNFKLGKKPFEN